MALELYNSNWYFHEVLNEVEQQEIEKDFSEFVNDPALFEFHSEWDQQLRYTSNKTTYLPWDKYLQQLTRALNIFTCTVGQKEIWTILPRSNWIAKYDKGYNQGVQSHNARNVNLMMIYFYDVDESDQIGFRFYHPENAWYESTGLSEFFDMPFHQYFVPEVKKGSLLIFPSNTPHLEMSYKGDTPKITFNSTMQVVSNRWPDENQGIEVSDMDMLENPRAPLYPMMGWMDV